MTVHKTEPYNKHIKVHNSEPKNKSTTLQKVPGKTGTPVKKEYRDRKKSHVTCSIDHKKKEVERMKNTRLTPIQDEYSVLSARELATRLHIGRDKAYALIKSKSFPSIKLGGRYIVTSKALNEWLDMYEYKTFNV